MNNQSQKSFQVLSPNPNQTKRSFTQAKFPHWKGVSPWVLNTEYCVRDGTALSHNPDLTRGPWALNTEYCPGDGTALSHNPDLTRGPWVLNAEYYPGSRQKLEENVHEQSKSKQQFSFRPYPNLITHKSNSHIGKESFHGCSIQNIAPEMEQHEASIQICTQATFPYWGGESMGAQ